MTKQKLSASALRNKLTSIASRGGGRLDDIETTPGACKAWVAKISPSKFAELLRSNKIRISVGHFFGLQINGDGFEAYRSGRYLFIACYRKSKAGEDYSSGIDG